MDMRINQTQAAAPVEQKAPVSQADGNFKFTLASTLEESALSERLTALMGEINEQGEKITIALLSKTS